MQYLVSPNIAFHEVLSNCYEDSFLFHTLDCHVNDPKTRNGSQHDLNVVVIVKIDSIGNGLKP